MLRSWPLDNRLLGLGLDARGMARRGGVLNQDQRDRIRYPRSLLARQSRPWRYRPPRRSVALADQLDAYLSITAPLRHRVPEAAMAVQGTLWEDGPIPMQRERQVGPFGRRALPTREDRQLRGGWGRGGWGSVSG